MYTRSYSGGSGKPSVLPPDYSGTSLTSGLEEMPSAPRQQPIPSSGMENSRRHSERPMAERHPRRSSPVLAQDAPQENEIANQMNNTTMRRPGAVISNHFRSTYPLRGPFDITPPVKEENPDNGNGSEDADDADRYRQAPSLEENGDHSADHDNEKLFGGIFPKANMNSDDLLLLGLLFLLWNEDKSGGDGCREAMMLLALLYLSGL